jgi:hypothetical protein
MLGEYKVKINGIVVDGVRSTQWVVCYADITLLSYAINCMFLGLSATERAVYGAF